MKPTTPRWIAFGTVALMAVVSILVSPSPADQVVGTLLFLAYLLIGIMIGEQKTMVSVAPAIALGWLLFGCQIAAPVPLSVESLITVLERTFDRCFIATDTPIALIAFAALMAVQVFFRASDNKILITLRYLILVFFFLTTSATPMMFQMLTLIALLAMSFELRTNSIDRKKRVLSSLYLWLLLQLAYTLHGESLFAVLFAANSTFSVYTIIGVGVLGGLMTMEKASGCDVFYLPAYKEIGPVVLFWSATGLLTLLFPTLSNINVLVLFPLVMFHLYHIFMKAWENAKDDSSFFDQLIYYSNQEKEQKKLFYVIWPLVCVLLLALSKSIYADNLLTSIFLAIAPVTAAICWSIAQKGGKKDGENVKDPKETMLSFLGVISVITLAVSTRVDASDPIALATFILTVALLCVFWCMLSSRICTLNKTASKVSAEEFKLLSGIRMYAPLLVIVIAVFKILLAKPVV